MSENDDLVSHKGVIIAIAILAGVVAVGLGWLCTKALVGNLNSTLLKMRGGSPTARMRVGSPVGYLDPAPNATGNGHYYPASPNGGGSATPYGAGPYAALPPRGAGMSVSPTRGAGFTAPHPRGAAVSVAPPHVPSATPPQSPSLTLATVPADEDIVAAMVEQNGFLRRDSRKSRRPTIAALDDAPHEVTALLAKIDEAQHASSGTLDEGITVNTVDTAEVDEVAKLQAKQDRIRAAQAAQRDAEERLAADLLADALKADAAELEHQQRQAEQKLAADLLAAAAAEQANHYDEERRVADVLAAKQAADEEKKKKSLADQRAAAAARVLERKAEVARARAAREADEARAKRAEEVWERAAPSMPGMGKNANSRAAGRALSGQPGGEPTAVANHEMDMVAKLQARQDRIHDAQIAQRKAEQELEADLVAEATDAAGDDVGAFGQSPSTRNPNLPLHSLGLDLQARPSLTSSQVKNSRLAKLHEQNQTKTFEVVKFKRPKPREKSAAPSSRRNPLLPRHSLGIDMAAINQFQMTSGATH